MTCSGIIDDLANKRHLPQVLALAGEGELRLERLRRLACGSAAPGDVEEYGDQWTRSLVDLLQRGGIGRLERREDGRIVFVFADELPTARDAWDRALADIDV
jgi:hypothetical protein